MPMILGRLPAAPCQTFVAAQSFIFQHNFMKGTVKRFYFRKGFGFIEGDQGTEYFFHYSDFTGSKDDLRPGLEVEFEPQQGEKGPCAVAVVTPGGKPAPARPRPATRGPAAAAAAQPAANRQWLFVAGLVVGLLIGAGAVWLMMRQ